MKYLIRLADYAGVAASALCLVHCLALPLLMAAFPLLRLGAEQDGLHAALLLAATIPALLALLPGYLRHRDPAALLLGMSGVGLFLAALSLIGPRWGHGAETGAAVLASALLLSAHLRNRNRCRRCP